MGESPGSPGQELESPGRVTVEGEGGPAGGAVEMDGNEAQMLQEHQMLQNQMDEMNEEEYKQQQQEEMYMQ